MKRWYNPYSFYVNIIFICISGGVPVKDHSRAWSTEARLQFIEFRLYWEGRINRGDLTQHFGISVPQSSIDLRRYVELAPENVEYDTKRKAYFATTGFQPKLITPSSRDYLAQLEMLQAEQDSPFSHESFVSSPPSFDSVPLPDRVVQPSTLRAIIKAIRDGNAINILYQSMTRPEPTNRWISPHAIGSDGFRWHIRAYCHERNRFGDFVFGRILDLADTKESNAKPEDDNEWNTLVELTIAPNPVLPEAHQRVIELDYGMENSQVKLVVRKALASYLKKRLGLIKDIAGKGAESDSAIAKQHIHLVREVNLTSGTASTESEI